MGRTRVLVRARTDVGRTRDHNEDNFGYREATTDEVASAKGHLLLVCDGMGGHAAGEVASQIAIDTILSAYYDDPSEDPRASLTSAVKLANRRIFEQSSSNRDQQGMGTTCVAAVIRGDELIMGYVGDSRGYLLRDGQLKQVTRDHSWVGQQVEMGLLAPEDAKDHPMMNIITRALGHHPDVEVDIASQKVQVSDVVLLCSDGLSGQVDDAKMQQIVEEAELLENAASALINAANEAGGPDNITVVLGRVDAVEPISAMTVPITIATVTESSEPITLTEQPATVDATMQTTPVTIESGPSAASAIRRSAPSCLMMSIGLLVGIIFFAAIGIAALLLGWVPFTVQGSSKAAGVEAGAAAAVAPSPTAIVPTPTVRAAGSAPVTSTVPTLPAPVPSVATGSLVGLRVQFPTQISLRSEARPDAPIIATALQTDQGRVFGEAVGSLPPGEGPERAPQGRERIWLQVVLDRNPTQPGWVWIGYVRVS